MDIWQFDPETVVPGHVERGRNNPDPRLHAEYYERSTALQTHYSNLSVAEQKLFRHYAIGRKVMSAPRNENMDGKYIVKKDGRIITKNTAALDQSIIREFGNADSEEFEKVGRRCLRRYRKVRFPPPDVPAATGHDYVPGGANPPPTIGDVAHVQVERPVNRDYTWRFERTVYQNRHHVNNRRIVHLFVLVNEHGIIMDVSHSSL
jgi:hypothetical protein